MSRFHLLSFWFVLCSMTVVGIALPARQRTVEAVASAPAASPLPGLVAKLLRLPKGRHHYLRYYRQVVAWIAAHRHHLVKGKHIDWEALSGVMPQLRKMVHAINAGAPPDALLGKILASLTLSRSYLARDGVPWQYGRINDQIFISTLLTRRSRRLFVEGRKHDAGMWGRASLFLASQRVAQMGAPGVLGYWCNGYGSAPANLAALGLPSSNGKELIRLCRSAFKQEQRLFANSGFNTLGNRLISLHAGHVPKSILRGYLHSVAELVNRALAGHPFLGLVGLGSLEYVNRKLATEGHHATVNRIREWLATKAVEIDHDRGLSPQYRDTLLCWIKEAMGP